MPKLFLVAGVLALSGIIAGALSVSREPAVSAPVVAKFDSRWDMPDEPPLLMKADRLTLPTPEPETVAVARPDQPVETKPVKKPVKTPVEKTRTAEREVEHNVCTRHHMHRVETHGGRSWRCR